MLKSIKKIVYNKNSMPGMQEYIIIEIKEDKNTLEFVDNVYSNSIQNPKTIIVSNQFVEFFLDKLLRITADWNNKYEGKKMIDGTEWQLKIVFTDGNEKKYQGKNSFPYNFEYLNEIKSEFIKMALKEQS